MISFLHQTIGFWSSISCFKVRWVLIQFEATVSRMARDIAMCVEIVWFSIEMILLGFAFSSNYKLIKSFDVDCILAYHCFSSCNMSGYTFTAIEIVSRTSIWPHMVLNVSLRFIKNLMTLSSCYSFFASFSAPQVQVRRVA